MNRKTRLDLEEALKEEPFGAVESGVTQVWQTIQSDPMQQSLKMDVTLNPSPLGKDSQVGLDSLPRIAIAGWSAGEPELELGKTLGEGGMGYVCLAQQASLGREVAVKSLRGEKHDEQSLQKLLLEARVMGILEHPNIVPVHLLAAAPTDERGKSSADPLPLLVMKRIEGVSWRSILVGESPLPSQAKQGPDALSWHLDVLMQVCNAVHFAHSKGVVHRDLKPENVMIGAFGEVYLMDWGLALCLREGIVTGLERERQKREVAGTPGYMSPEMAKGHVHEVDERTDVYLLGATLHEIVTGHMRHQGDSLFAVLYSAYSSVPFVYDSRVPAELASICQKAMHVDPAQRYASAEEFREAIALFLRHRSSMEICTKANMQLSLMRQILESTECSLDAQQNLLVHELFGQCRFGFEEALRSWHENQEAHDGLEQALSSMVGYKVREGDLATADMLFAQIQKPSDSLKSAIQELRLVLAAEAEKRDELQRIEEAVDLKVGAGARSLSILLVGLCWGGFFFMMGWLERQDLYHVSHLDYALANIGIALFIGAIIFWKQRVLFQNAANQRLILLLYLAFLTFILLSWVGYCWGLSAKVTLSLAVLIIGLIMGILTIFIDFRLIGAPLIFLASLVGCVLAPEYAYEWQGLGDVLAFAWVALVWKVWTERLMGALGQGVFRRID